MRRGTMKTLLKDKSLYIFTFILVFGNLTTVLPANIRFYGYLLILLLFSIYLMKNNHVKHKALSHSMRYMFYPWLFAPIYTFILLLIGKTELEYFIGGMSDILKLLLIFWTGYELLFKYQERILNFLFLSFSFAYVILTINGFVQFGPLYILLMAFNLSEERFGWSVEGEAFDKIFEVHEFGLAFPLIALAYLWKSGDWKQKFFPIIISLLFSLICAKRIAIGAFLVVAVLSYILSHLPLIKRMFVKCGGLLFIVIIFSFLFFIYNGVYEIYAEQYDVDLKGRDIFYNYFISRSSFSFDYLGDGFGYIRKYLANKDPFNGIMGIHNDILRIYIELGAVGTFIFFSLMFGFNIRKHKIINNECSYYYILTSLYCLVTYFSDNTIAYSLIQFCNMILPYYLFLNKNPNSKDNQTNITTMRHRRYV